MQHPPIIMTGGSTPQQDSYYRAFLQETSYLITADSGLKVCFRLQIVPNLFIGDADSVAHSELLWAQEQGAIIKKFPPEKDATDTQLALDFLINNRHDTIHILGGIGSRLDHTLANLYLLLYGYEQGATVVLINHNHKIQLLSNKQTLKLTGCPGDLISILPITETLSGLTIEGCRWSMNKGALRRGPAQGVSNYLLAQNGTISLQQGLAFVMQVKE